MRAFLIFSGYNQRAVLAFLRTLVANDVKFGIISNGPTDTIYLSAYSKYVVYQRNDNILSADNIIKAIKNAKMSVYADRYFIAPSTESLNRLILDHRDRFNEIFVEIPLVENALYKRISDKIDFVSLCDSYGINVPGTYENVERSLLPFVAKPKFYLSTTGSSYKPQILRSKIDIENFISNYPIDDFFYQEFVEGDSIYLLYYISKDGIVHSFSQQNLVQQPNGGSIVLARSSNHYRCGIGKLFETMLLDLEFHGMIMIEVRVNHDKVTMIEANPRFWGPSQLFIDARMNLFEALLSDYDFIERKVSLLDEHVEVFYSWTGGLIDTLRRGEKSDSLNWSDMNLSQIELFLKNDVYMRSDSLEIFKKEMI